MIYALLIKGEPGTLKYIDNDMENISTVFQEIGIRVIAVSGRKVDVLEKLCEILDRLSNADTLIIYYTGHGNVKKGDVILRLGVSENASSVLSVRELTISITGNDVGKVVYIFDCCYASKAEDIWRQYGKENQCVFVPSSYLQTAQEMDRFQSSFFTYCICSELSATSSLRWQEDGTITIGMLYEAVKERVCKYNGENPNEQQPIPELYGVRGNMDSTVIGRGSRGDETAAYESDFKDYLNNYVTCIKHCKKSCIEKESWCTSVLKSDVNILEYVIPTVREFVSGSREEQLRKLNAYYEAWFAEPDNYVGLLGDVGVGKTTACAFLFYYLAKNYEKLHLVPVYLPLKDTVLSLRNNNIYVTTQHFMGDTITLDEVEYLCRNKRMVFIMDGFDEISTDSNIATILQNYENLKPFMRLGCKTMLTSRTQYFSQQDQLEEVLTGRTMGSDFAAALLSDEYPYDIIELQKFQEGEILELIAKLLPDKDSHEVWRQISDIYDLKDLARTAILLKMIVQTLSQLEKEHYEKIDSATLYSIYTKKMLRREIKNRRVGMDLNEKERLISYIANLMFENDRLTISTKEFEVEIKEYFSNSIYSQNELNSCSYDCKVSSFFSRDMQDNYTFIHKSFYEYYFARYCMIQISENNDGYSAWTVRWFPREIACFVKEIFSMEKYKHLIGKLIQVSLNAEDEILIWNSLHILSLLDVEDVKEWLSERIQKEYIARSEKEGKCVIIRQYCRIIAKFIDRECAERLIDKIIAIARSDSEENKDNDETYYNYYGGRIPACEAFIKHLSVEEPKYDAMLHLYLLEHIAPQEYADKIILATKGWKQREKYSSAIESALRGIRAGNVDEKLCG